MDATQQIEDSFFGEEDDSDGEHDQAEGKSEREPLAVLKVFKNNHIAEMEVPLYQGENVLGRDPTSCSVPLQARSVSGHHAIISITVFGPNDHRAHSEATEALLWDLGSLNGTRKGRSKLTPHVRYALTNGDGVVLADLPCQYVILKNTEKNTHTSTGEKARGQMSSSSSTEVETVKGVENIAKISTLPPVPVWSNEVKTPQLQMTPKQPEMTLVPESDSDSDGEKHRQRERRRIVASDSGTSDLSSPTCSTFLTPATKIIPESEDESSITPSPALKGKFQKAGNDTEVSSGSSKPDPLHFNIDSDTDVEDDDAEMSKATHGTAAVVPAKTVAVNPADLYMNSDTDAEEEETGKVKSDPEASGLAPAKSDLVNPAALNMDSDTDVEEDKPVKTDVVSSSGPAAVLEEKKDTENSAKFHLESDTDVEEEEEVCHIQDIRSLSSLVAVFNMNSDTDVEEEEQTTKALVQPCETDNYVPDAKMLPPESDNDTDVEEDDVTDIRTPTVAREMGNSETASERSTGKPHNSPVGAQPPAEALRDEIRLDSDTDVEEDEDKMDEKEQKCAEAAMQIVHSSTPRGAGLPEEEKETQAFLSPSQLFKRPGLPSLPEVSSVSPGGASHTDDDFAVAETQSFMGDAAQANATLDETPQSLDKYQRSGGAPSFQLDFADSSTNQMTEAEELNREPAEEDWQLQATQLYEGGTKSGPTPLDLDATQAFTDSIIREEEEDGRKEKEEEETPLLAAPSHSSIHSETQLIKPGAQNKNPSDSDENVGAGEPQRKAEEDVHDQMQADSHLSTADTLLIIRSPRQEEQTQPYAFLDEKIQEETEKEEHESKDEAIQQGGEGQRAQNGMMGHENNDERQTKEHEPVVIEAKNDVTRDAAEDEKKKGTEDEKEESENKVDEARTQPAEDDAIIATQPICKAKDEEEHEEEQLNEPSSSKGTWTAQGESVQCIKAKHHTHDAVAIAETLPMCEEEEEEEEDKFKNSRRPGRRRQPAETVEPKRSVESGNVTHLTIAETLPLCEEDSERQEEQSEAMSTKRSSIRRQNVMSHVSHVTIPETLPLCDEEEGREEEPQNEAKSVRKSRRGKQTAKVEAAQPLDADFTAETLKTEEKEEEPDGRKSLRGSAASVKARGRGRVAVEKEVDGGNKGREGKNLRQKSKNDDEARLKLVGAENEELERLKKQEDEEEIERLQETRDQLEREKSMRLVKERKEREEQEKREQEEKDRLERERINHEKKAREEKEQIEREMKEREEKEKFEREKHLEKGRREREEKEKLEKKKQEEKDRLAREKREEGEMRKEKEKQEKEMELREKEIKGHEDSVEKEHRQAPGRRKTVRKGGKNKKEEEQDKDEGTKESRESEQELSEKQKKECEEGSSKKPEEELAESAAKPRRGRRTARKSVAPPAAVEDEGGPAKRTRSRSNSSNSVCSEQSTQASLNEGRRRGRRTTTVIPSEKADTRQTAHSRSNSISSERSSGSVATQSRGRGATRRKSVKVEEPEEEKEEKRKRSTALGRGGGRGRGGKRPGANELKAEAAGEAEKEEGEISAIAAEDSVMSQSSSRGRKRGADISRAETPQPISKTPRRSIAGPTHKVLFTGVADEDGEKVVVRLGGALAKGSSDMTHLVTDKVRRTVKFLCAVARGVPIVTPDWLSKCGKAGSFLSPNGFLVKDVEQEKRFNFSLQDALRVASSQPLLQGYEIHVTPSVKPEPVQMKEIITCCGARFLPKMPYAHKAQVVVVSCEEDRALCERAQSLSFPVVSAEFLLTGILQQKVDVQAHALSLSTTASVPKPNARRRGK